MKSKWLLGPALSLSWGCAASSPEVSSSSESLGRIERVRAQHTQLKQLLSAAPADHVATCKHTSGDCLLQVAESRAQLVGSLRLDPCEAASDSELKSSCIVKQLDARSHGRELGDYLSLDAWCLQKLTACTASQADQARARALDVRFAERRREIDQAPAVVKAEGGLALGLARVEYLRATLPPAASEVCRPDAAFAACTAPLEEGETQLDDSLRRDEYDAATAISTYASLRQARAACATPELACLSGALATYGVYPETRKWVERNLELLARRQELLTRVSEPARSECLSGSRQEYQGDIVSAYVAYVREPVLYFRMQLDKTFLKLHQAEIGCLTTRVEPAATRQTVATKR